MSETFTATHLVAIFTVSVMAPSMLYAAVVYSNVAVTDGGNGIIAHVDKGRRLWTYDPVADLTRNLQLATNIYEATAQSFGYHTLYTVPAGKALVVKSITWTDFNNTEGNNSFYYIYGPDSRPIYNTEGIHIANSASAMFEPGLIVRAGAMSGQYFGTGATRIYVQGYLVPANSVPAPTSAEAAEQFVSSGKPMARGRPQ